MRADQSLTVCSDPRKEPCLEVARPTSLQGPEAEMQILLHSPIQACEAAAEEKWVPLSDRDPSAALAAALESSSAAGFVGPFTASSDASASSTVSTLHACSACRDAAESDAFLASPRSRAATCSVGSEVAGPRPSAVFPWSTFACPCEHLWHGDSLKTVDETQRASFTSARRLSTRLGFSDAFESGWWGRKSRERDPFMATTTTTASSTSAGQELSSPCPLGESESSSCRGHPESPLPARKEGHSHLRLALPVPAPPTSLSVSSGSSAPTPAAPGARTDLHRASLPAGQSEAVQALLPGARHHSSLTSSAGSFVSPHRRVLLSSSLRSSFASPVGTPEAAEQPAGASDSARLRSAELALPGVPSTSALAFFSVPRVALGPLESFSSGSAASACESSCLAPDNAPPSVSSLPSCAIPSSFASPLWLAGLSASAPSFASSSACSSSSSLSSSPAAPVSPPHASAAEDPQRLHSPLHHRFVSSPSGSLERARPLSPLAFARKCKETHTEGSVRDTRHPGFTYTREDSESRRMSVAAGGGPDGISLATGARPHSNNTHRESVTCRQAPASEPPSLPCAHSSSSFPQAQSTWRWHRGEERAEERTKASEDKTNAHARHASTGLAGRGALERGGVIGNKISASKTEGGSNPTAGCSSADDEALAQEEAFLLSRVADAIGLRSDRAFVEALDGDRPHTLWGHPQEAGSCRRGRVARWSPFLVSQPSAQDSDAERSRRQLYDAAAAALLLAPALLAELEQDFFTSFKQAGERRESRMWSVWSSSQHRARGGLPPAACASNACGPALLCELPGCGAQVVLHRLLALEVCKQIRAATQSGVLPRAENSQPRLCRRAPVGCPLGLPHSARLREVLSRRDIVMLIRESSAQAPTEAPASATARRQGIHAKIRTVRPEEGERGHSVQGCVAGAPPPPDAPLFGVYTYANDSHRDRCQETAGEHRESPTSLVRFCRPFRLADLLPRRIGSRRHELRETRASDRRRLAGNEERGGDSESEALGGCVGLGPGTCVALQGEGAAWESSSVLSLFPRLLWVEQVLSPFAKAYKRSSSSYSCLSSSAGAASRASHLTPAARRAAEKVADAALSPSSRGRANVSQRGEYAEAVAEEKNRNMQPGRRLRRGAHETLYDQNEGRDFGTKATRRRGNRRGLASDVEETAAAKGHLEGPHDGEEGDSDSEEQGHRCLLACRLKQPGCRFFIGEAGGVGQLVAAEILVGCPYRAIRHLLASRTFLLRRQASRVLRDHGSAIASRLRLAPFWRPRVPPSCASSTSRSGSGASCLPPPLSAGAPSTPAPPQATSGAAAASRPSSAAWMCGAGTHAAAGIGRNGESDPDKGGAAKRGDEESGDSTQARESHGTPTCFPPLVAELSRNILARRQRENKMYAALRMQAVSLPDEARCVPKRPDRIPLSEAQEAATRGARGGGGYLWPWQDRRRQGAACVWKSLPRLLGVASQACASSPCPRAPASSPFASFPSASSFLSFSAVALSSASSRNSSALPLSLSSFGARPASSASRAFFAQGEWPLRPQAQAPGSASQTEEAHEGEVCVAALRSKACSDAARIRAARCSSAHHSPVCFGDDMKTVSPPSKKATAAPLATTTAAAAGLPIWAPPQAKEKQGEGTSLRGLGVAAEGRGGERGERGRAASVAGDG
ncbi:hypothetical protein BESB_059910 [Besnoitia besnoiti]|uniref:Uncharacterized protein n=1 Tax=Besnoitia besnoiti TaxID=94643 RepID=A0A2A9MD17_BESBE|nr:hypothetical protein BESB_059910 [Besnoitia besnoiti]PFH35104.1 hypothetical protein BESB_059910 [Besnoitia besnoiti]